MTVTRPRALRRPGGRLHRRLAGGAEQGTVTLTDDPAHLAATFVALEDGYQLEILAGRRTRDYVLARIVAHASAVIRCDLQS